MQKWVEEMNIDEERVTVPERSNRRGSGWLNIVFGIGVIISPFVLGFHSPKAIWNNVITGVVVGVLALIRWEYASTRMELAKSDPGGMASDFTFCVLSQRSCDVE
jgi:branched-subunit amino acid permease